MWLKRPLPLKSSLLISADLNIVKNDSESYKICLTPDAGKRRLLLNYLSHSTKNYIFWFVFHIFTKSSKDLYQNSQWVWQNMAPKFIQKHRSEILVNCSAGVDTSPQHKQTTNLYIPVNLWIFVSHWLTVEVTTPLQSAYAWPQFLWVVSQGPTQARTASKFACTWKLPSSTKSQRVPGARDIYPWKYIGVWWEYV